MEWLTKGVLVVGKAGEHPYIIFGQPLIGEEEIGEVLACLRDAWIGTGPRVARFERDFAAYKGAEQAVALGSCTAALHLATVVAGIGPGDEVIVPAMTFCATVNAVIHAGATPVLADVDPETFNIAPEDVERRITGRTRAIIAVHFAGRPCDMGAIQEIAGRHGLKVIEDCAHAVETRYCGAPAGTMGDFGCFSFYATKNVTCGEGGMVLARRAEDAERIKILALHGLSGDAWKRFGDEGYRHYDVVDAGFKCNMTDLQAALGVHQLARVDAALARRAEIWRRYVEAFAGLPLGLPAPFDGADGSRHALHLFTVLVEPERSGVGRDEFLGALDKRGIGAGVHYRAIPEHLYYREAFGWRPDDYPNALRIGRQTASLPLSPKLSDGDVERVIHAVRLTLGAVA